MTDFFERVAALRQDGQSFAVATVVARQAPVSAHLGDRAIIFPDGRMEGFVGGACSREIVRRQALEALQMRSGRLVSIRTDADAAASSSAEHVVVPMTCVSEGAIDVYVEPFVRARRLVIVGATPVAEALGHLARTMDYDVVRAVEAHERQDIEPAARLLNQTVVALDGLAAALEGGDMCDAAVVASQGHYDEEALTTILHIKMPYVGLVASAKRGASVRQLLAESGVPNVETIRNPAGLDLGARTPPEVALSILAEIVQMQPGASPVRNELHPASTAPATAAETTKRSAPGSSGAVVSSLVHAVDPVCGMHVEIATARHVAEFEGVTYYFCCPHCRASFVKQPRDHIHPAAQTARGKDPVVRNPA